MLYSDEAGERDLRVAKRYAPVTSTRQDASISESLKHELYQKFVQKKKKIPCAKIWAPVQRNVVLEVHGCCQCRVACGLPTPLGPFAAFPGWRWLLPIYAPKHPFCEMHLSRCKSRE